MFVIVLVLNWLLLQATDLEWYWEIPILFLVDSAIFINLSVSSALEARRNRK